MSNDWQCDREMTRRGVLRGGASLALLGTMGLDKPVFAQSGGFDWKKFKGEKIEVSLVKNGRSDILQKYRKEFEDLTGISVGDEQVPEQQHRQKQVIEFNAGSPSFDVTTISWHVQKRLFGKSRWLADLRPYLADKSLTFPDYDFDDIAKGALIFGTQSDGRIDSLPLSVDYFLIYWNKAMFEAKGVAYPKTYDEMMAAAAKLHDPAKNQYGFVARGIKNANVYTWASLMLGWDEDTMKPNGELNTDGPAALAAAQYYLRMTKEFSPPGVAGYNWNECQSVFALGQAAMWPDSIGFAPPLEDPGKSKIVGKVGYGVVPIGPKAQVSGVTGDGIGVASASKKQGPAFFYAQWASSKLVQARYLQSGAGAGARNALYTDAKVMSEVKVPKEWVDCIIGSAKIGRPCLPNIIPVTEFRDVFGIALANMIGGADPATELKKATEQFKPVLEKSEKG